MPAVRTIPTRYKARLAALRRRMRTVGVALLIVTRRADHYYLTGFSGEDSAVLITGRSVHVVTDGRFETSLKAEAPWAQVTIRTGHLVDAIAEAARKFSVSRIGIQPEGVTAQVRDQLKRKLRGKRLVDLPDAVADLRISKDADELSLIRKAIRIAEQAFAATLDTLRIGQTELEIAARLEYEMKRRGSTSPAFDTIAAIDANAALPHAVPGERRLRRGCTLLIDWGATFGQYHSDLTRTVFIDSIDPTLGKVYEAVRRAQKEAIAAIRPGARMCDVDGVARSSIERSGFGDYFSHGLGHGVGLDVHEAPSLSWRSKAILSEAMVVTVEPGVYLPGHGGVRIEDDVLVTASGHRVLSRLDSRRKSAVLRLPQ